MKFGRLPSRWTPWVLAAALLLRAAMPWLASASAEMQGKALVEVCTVYGVSTVALDAGDHPQHAAAHHGDLCALTALGALASVAANAPALAPSRARAAAPLTARRTPPARDACATWVARRKHGPPAFS